MAQEMKVVIKRQAVNSSNIKSVGYSSTGKVLEVEFWGRPNDRNTTKVYRYWPVLEEAYKELISAESLGGHFNKTIKMNEKISYLEVN